MTFTFKQYGTFTGPNALSGDYQYDALSVEGIWQGNLPVDTSFKLTDVAMVLYNVPADYVGMYINGSATSVLNIAKSTGLIPTVIHQVSNTIINGKTITNGNTITNGTATINGSTTINGSATVNGTETVNGALTVTGAITSPTITSLQALAGKGFDIPHPTKDNHRLRYICLEGPEVGAYIRGTLKDYDTIELPDYWRKLCKSETITVNLTPIGKYQKLYVEEGVQLEGTRIRVKTKSKTPIHCHYTVFAERVTNDKLQVEYEGLTPYDYPGDNSEYALGGWDYATHKGEHKSPNL
jgi:cytoskeletal protein CcmA (bactofilin family)